MLDTDTKRRIDTARDILVGKVPDPKSQVEQITIAMIYKFMDDMDAEAEELGGARSFFAGDYARYGWAKLMRSGLGGHETLALYAEAITKMPENPGIPALFRDIFKNAYLPYRDPETLRAFLKIIDEFTYDHSEKLGDAFEYLLSVLGSQGDAGQFRSPRHIIDFMVAIIDPKKSESVLDPACGTVGFLISAFKHILRANTDKKGHVTLTPDDKARLAANFKGYDISPDMVRLSLVNLYLHGFTEPHVYEYDTLTSEERWNENFDVILANPPFMSPKGGIKPHKRFSIQAKRSEVLFVDYIAEHLTPNGRAAIIVPEGIIFQSQGAYKELRKMLVENSLVAVISLPAGCFNPYSGVKTSILILDKALARQSDSIGFFKVENDGFGLGAQRRAVGGEELTQVKTDIEIFLQALRDRQPTADLKPTCGLIVPKEQIAANGDYNLSGERYREGAVSSSSFPSVALGEVCELARGVVFAKDDEVPEGGVQVLRANNINKDRYKLNLDDIKRVSPKSDFSDEKKLRKNDIFICLASGSKDHVGKVALIKEDTDFYFGGFMGAIRVKSEDLDCGSPLPLSPPQPAAVDRVASRLAPPKRQQADAVQVQFQAETAPKNHPSPEPTEAARPTHPDELEKSDLMSLLRDVLTEHGPCDRDTAIKQAATSLGHQRVRSNVAESLSNAIRTAVKRQVLLNGGSTLSVNRASVADYDKDFLKTQFLAALSEQGRVWTDREDAIRAFTRWLGFRRTGSKIDETARSLINGLLREGRLEKDGDTIRRK